MELNELGREKLAVNIAGETVEIEREKPVKETIKSLLEARGIDSFTLFINGSEVLSSDDIPDTFEDVESLEVRRYVKAG